MIGKDAGNDNNSLVRVKTGTTHTEDHSLAEAVELEQDIIDLLLRVYLLSKEQIWSYFDERYRRETVSWALADLKREGRYTDRKN